MNAPVNLVTARGAANAQNLVELLEATALRLGDRTCCRHKRDGQWRDVTWSQLVGRVRAVAAGLASLGVEKGDRVAVIGETSLEFAIADLAILEVGAIVVPIYQSNKPHECRYVLVDSGASWVFCDGEGQASKLHEVRGELPGVKGVIRWAGDPGSDWERTMASLEAAGEAWLTGNEGARERRVASIASTDTAHFIYTSGTTGNPKGAVLTHANWVYEASAVRELGIVDEGDVVLFFLPMAHSFAQVLAATWLSVGAVGVFAESVDRLVQNAGEVRPTVIPAVPRVFEKAYDAVVAQGLAAPGLGGRLFRLAMEGFEEHVAARGAGRETASLRYLLAKRLVFPRIARALKERFGGRMRLFISGSAPLAPKIGYFFELLGVTVLEGYGLTETSAATCVNRPWKNKIGTVGAPIPGTEIKIAADGEILIRGPGVMKGYHGDPEATAEALRDGWFHSGDIGSLDGEGYLEITDRKKDIIVTSGGKNVAPQNLECELRTDPLLSQVVVHGDKRKFLTALVTLNEGGARRWAAENGLAGSSLAELSRAPALLARLQVAIDAVNARHASFETIKRFAVLSHELTVEGGELTPTLKVKRRVCSQKYKDVLDALYAG